MDTNWYVITGGPFAGKTTLIEALRHLGHTIEEESARAYLDGEFARGRTVADIRADEGIFQQKVLEHKFARHERLLKNDTIFFDRGIPDSLAYLRANELAATPGLEEAMKQYSYRKVFL